MDTNKLSLVENEYDDGVVCFGPVTESQLNRYKRLPRRTVLPSDFELSQSFLEQDEDKKNDQSTILSEPNENTTTCVDNSINITRSTNNFDEEKEEIGTIELKQSISEDSNLKFSSPCFSKCIPNAKLIDTEVINRYIRMGSTSSDDSSLSEDQNMSTFEDETVSFTDVQETESIQENDVFDQTSTCEHFSVPSVIEQSTSTNQQNVLDDSNNVCTLIHCSQKDDTDLSICSDSELGDVTEDSIVADEYSVTPGKQRLFDLRVTKQSLRAKALVASAPFMDRIEETTTPIEPKVLNSPSILNDISYRQSEIKESLVILSNTEIRHGTSTELFNQTSNENSKFIDETAEQSLISNDLKNIVSVNKSDDTIIFDETINTNKLSTDGRIMNINKSLNKTDQIKNTLNDTVHISDNEQSMNILNNITIPTIVNGHNEKEYLIAPQLDTKSINTSVEDIIFDETMNTNKLSTNNRSIDLNQSLNKTDHIQSAINDTNVNFDDEKLMCISSNEDVPTPDINCQNDEEFSVAMEVDIKSTNTSYVDKETDETIYTNKLSINNRTMDLNESVDKFHEEKSVCIISKKAISASDISVRNDEEFSVAMEVDIKSTNTSFVDKEIDETMYTNKLSINNLSTVLKNSLNETNVENTFNNTKQNDNEKSTYIMSNIAIPTSDVNELNDEESSIVKKVDIKSINTSVGDKIFDETVSTNKLSTNNQSMDLNQSLNETNVKNTFNNIKQKCDDVKSATGINDYYDEEFSVAMEVDIKSTNTSFVDKEIDETMYTNRLSINNLSTVLKNSLNETNVENTFNNTKQNDNEKSTYIMSNIAIPTSDVNELNYEENSMTTEVDIKSINTSVVDKIFDETVNTNKHSIKNQSMDLNKSLNGTESNFDGEKSMNIMPNITVPTYAVNDHNDEESSVDIKSTNTSCMDKELNETVYTNKLSTNDQSMNLNKSLNDTEQNFDDEKENSIATEVDINKSTNISVVDKIFDKTVNTNKLLINNLSMNLNKSLIETNNKNTLNDTEHKFDGEKSMNIMPDITVPTSAVNDNNDEESSVDIKSTNTSCMDKELNETVYTNKLSTNDQSMNLNKSLNDTEQNFDDEKENSIATEVDIKSINTSIVDKIFDESMLINANKILTDSKTMSCNESLNETESTSNNTEHRFNNNIQNTSVSSIHFDDKLHLNKLDKSILKNTINSNNSFVGINEVNITCNTSIEDPSCMMRQYLDFEQAVNEMCNDISSASCPGGKSNKPKESYDDETLEHLIAQTLSSDTFNLTKVNENFSSYDGSNLSVIIENKSLESSCSNIEQNESLINSNNDVPMITLESECMVNEVKDAELLNKSTVVNTVATPSKSEVDLAYETDFNTKIKTNENISINCSVTDSGLVENMNETKHKENSMFSNELSKMELNAFTKINKNLNNVSIKQIFIPGDVNEIHSMPNTLGENKFNPIVNQVNISDIPNSTAFKLIPETEITQKNLIDQNELLNNDNQHQDLLDTTKSIDTSLEEFTNLEQMFNFGDNKKEKQLEYKTPKTQKLLDFSIVQQTPTFDNQAKKQKLLNFSIVDQTPILKSTQQVYSNENVISNESLINFSAVDKIWNSEVAANDEIDFKDFQNYSNDSSSNNLSTISPPQLELLADESIKKDTSNCSNSSFDQTITDSNINMEPLMINRQIVADDRSGSLNQTIEQNELKQQTFYDKQCVAEASTKGVKLISNTNTSNKNINSEAFKEDPNQELCFDSNERAIVDFSIIDQGMLKKFELKNNTDITSIESDRNVSNLIEMSLVTKSDEQSIISSETPLKPKTSDNKSEKSVSSSSDKINSTALHLEESTYLHNNTELLNDIQMNDESLFMESPEKSSIIDSFHSIELDHVQEDNKRKMDTTQDCDNNEKKMKVETETLKTPMSMLYKIKNMFRSSEKQPSCVNNTKENNFRSDKCYQKLNFNKFEENNDDFTKPTPLKKSEVIVKSKIPCKITDRSLPKTDEFNNSSLSSLNDSIKQKKTIPKFSGVPVLSDVSNSSNRKCAESRIPSKFQK